MRLTLEEVLITTGGTITRPEARGPRPVITGVSTDSRTLRPGDLFVPLRGPRADGHDFIAEAFRRGAAASLCARPVDGLLPEAPVIQVADPLRALGEMARAYRTGLSVTVVGITGSVGKTTTTKMCAAVLDRQFRVVVTREDWNAEIGVPLTLLALRRDHQVAVIEMAMRGLGQIADLVRIAQPSIGVVTSIGESHLEFLGSRENIARAKGELIAGLPADGVAVLNRDEALVAGLARLCRGRILSYGLAPGADLTAHDIRLDRAAVTFRIAAGVERADVRLRAWGRHNVSNALAAAAVGMATGMDLGGVAEGLSDYTPPKMRLEPVVIGDILVINDAYNASPSSMRAAFDVLEDVGQGHRLIAVLGEMKELGAESVALHREVGRDFGRRSVSALIAVGPEAAAIAEGAAEAGLDRAAITTVSANEEAARALQRVLRKGDVVLVKGSRAMQMEQIVETLQRES